MIITITMKITIIMIIIVIKIIIITMLLRRTSVGPAPVHRAPDAVPTLFRHEGQHEVLVLHLDGPRVLLPVSVLRFWISEGLTQAES